MDMYMVVPFLTQFLRGNASANEAAESTDGAVGHASCLPGSGAALLPGKTRGRAFCSQERTHRQGSQDSSLGTPLG